MDPKQNMALKSMIARDTIKLARVSAFAATTHTNTHELSSENIKESPVVKEEVLLVQFDKRSVVVGSSKKAGIRVHQFALKQPMKVTKKAKEAEAETSDEEVPVKEKSRPAKYPRDIAFLKLLIRRKVKLQKLEMKRLRHLKMVSLLTHLHLED